MSNMEFSGNGAEEQKSELPTDIRFNSLMREMEALMARNQELVKIIQENGLDKKSQATHCYGNANGGIPVQQFPTSSSGTALWGGSQEHQVAHRQVQREGSPPWSMSAITDPQFHS
jgi:hypothetical protein